MKYILYQGLPKNIDAVCDLTSLMTTESILLEFCSEVLDALDKFWPDFSEAPYGNQTLFVQWLHQNFYKIMISLQFRLFVANSFSLLQNKNGEFTDIQIWLGVHRCSPVCSNRSTHKP